MAVKILQALALSPEDQNEFFKSIARVQKARGLKRQNPVFRKSDTALPAVESPVRELSLELFKVIADWYHYAILELTFLPEFKPTAAWIAGKLGISEIEAKLALERLKKLELLLEKNGTLVKADGQVLTADRMLTTAAHRKRQRQILEKSLHALENDPVEQRNHSAMTMAIDPSRLSEAKRRIDEFTQELCKFLETGVRSQVFEMQVSLFSHTQLKKGATYENG
jgi:uncharacterized protein (TIGR02147 family)